MAKNRILSQLDVVSQCRRYGIPLWECPQFLFMIMGLIICVFAVIFYLLGISYKLEPEVAAFLVLFTVAILFVISYIITKSFERMAEASRLKSEFIDIISHQLRTPLTNLKWSFEVVSSKDIKLTDVKKEECYDNIKENLSRMVELIDDLLVISRIETGRLPIVKKELSLEEIIKDQISHFNFFAKASRVEIDFKKEGNIPKVYTDYSLIRMVIENLIDNAIHYSRGKGKIEISLEKKGKNKVLFKIKDNGIGIPKEDQKFIFRKFFRSENAKKKKTRGSGLGLYVCRSIIEKLGGKIWFKSEENKGTTFYFTLPIK